MRSKAISFGRYTALALQRGLHPLTRAFASLSSAGTTLQANGTIVADAEVQYNSSRASNESHEDDFLTGHVDLPDESDAVGSHDDIEGANALKSFVDRLLLRAPDQRPSLGRC